MSAPSQLPLRIGSQHRNQYLFSDHYLKEDYACVLGFVEHQLSQEPERADVVHDLLAYLAEQMITMHRQKQQIVKTFWLDLEGEVEAAELAKLRKGKQEATLARQGAITPFVNPGSHSSRTLEEALAWDEAAFKAFVKVLAGNLSGFSKLVGLYRTYSPDYRRLARQIEATDRLIDGIVYGLYGLTEEEIEIVEGRV